MHHYYYQFSAYLPTWARLLYRPDDDDGAKKQVETLLAGFGYSAIDLGNLRDGGLMQQAGGPLAGAKFVGARRTS